jgi:hypothetical protein
MKSGYDFPIDDWSVRHQDIAQVIDRQFTQSVFHSYPSLRSQHPVDGWTESKPYHGEPFNEAEWTLKPDGWNHEHCSLCYATITDGMTYWANDREVTILCDYCYDHYKGQLK